MFVITDAAVMHRSWLVSCTLGVLLLIGNAHWLSSWELSADAQYGKPRPRLRKVEEQKSKTRRLRVVQTKAEAMQPLWPVRGGPAVTQSVPHSVPHSIVRLLFCLLASLCSCSCDLSGVSTFSCLSCSVLSCLLSCHCSVIAASLSFCKAASLLAAAVARD